jgi:hypothetical protein
MGGWSSRSQRDVLRQLSLQKALARCEASVAKFETEVGRLTRTCEGKTARIAEGEARGHHYYVELLRELEDAKHQLAAFQKHGEILKQEIGALANPTPKRAKERAEGQARMARLATERLAKDELIAGAVKKLRSVLEERTKLTAEMMRGAAAIDLTLAQDGLDQSRFDVLAGSLPTDLQEKSEAWLRRFFGGSREGTKTYTVIRGPFTLPETLASVEIYSEDERVQLTREEGGRLLAELRPRVKGTSLLEKLLVG